MKTKFTLTLCFITLYSSFILSARAQGTAFTYHGRLNDGANPATGIYDFQFRVFDTAPTNTGTSLGSPNPNSTNAVGVTNGLFTVILDFGNNPFTTGAPRWLDVAVRTNGNGSFSTLNPRQAVTATPYAITASNITGVVSSAGLAGTCSSPVTLNNPANNFSGIGSGLTGLNASSISSGTLADARLSANVALRAGGNTFSGRQTINGQIRLDSTDGFSQSSVGNFYIDAPFIIGGRVSVLTNGNVGIGTANPSRRLEVQGPGDVEIGLESTDATWTRLWTLQSTHGELPFGVPQPWDGSFQIIDRTAGASRLSILGNGNVGIGTNNPTRKLEVQGNGDVEIGLKSADAGGRLWTIQSSGTYGNALDGTFQIVDRTLNASRLTIDNYGQIFWGTSYLGTDQHGSIELGDSTAADGIPFIDFHKGVGQFQDFNVRLMNNTNGQLSLFGNFYVTGNASACSLTIRGGCDLAEPFEISDREISKGSLVIIDEENPGKLRLAGQEYDTRVAGIVSGANGVNPGISLRQEGTIEGGQNIALSGRVYALADASYGAIKPGDLLTSSGTPGHVMKVIDHTRAQGAIVGKAMSTLKAGRGMVLVLVSLQ